MSLNTITTGAPGDAPPVILVHGLMGSARNLGGLARRLAGRHVIQVDMRNHGDSPWHDDHSYPTMAGDLARVITDAGGLADVVGHSMGGKAAMVTALLHPAAVRRLVVLDIAPVVYGHSQSPLIDAMESIDLPAVTRRSDADRMLTEAGVDEAGTRAFLLQSLEVTPGQPARWRMNLKALRAEMDKLTGWPEGLIPGAFTGPVLALYGGRSDYVTEDSRAALQRWFSQVDMRCIEGVGHWLHAEAPEVVGDAVAGFLG